MFIILFNLRHATNRTITREGDSFPLSRVFCNEKGRSFVVVTYISFEDTTQRRRIYPPCCVTLLLSTQREGYTCAVLIFSTQRGGVCHLVVLLPLLTNEELGGVRLLVLPFSLSQRNEEVYTLLIANFFDQMKRCTPPARVQLVSTSFLFFYLIYF